MEYEEDCINVTSPVSTGAIYVTMISSLCSLLGSSLIIITFIIWPDLRTTARAILVFLAIADFLTAFGYFFASILFFLNDYSNSSSPISPRLCTFQSFITTAFPISSFLWTANLAIYLFVSITLQKVRVARKLMLLFHITAWGIPLILCIPGAATGVLGDKNVSLRYPEQGTVAWCWVSFNNSFDVNTTVPDAVHRLIILHVLELVFGKFWELSAFFLSIVFYIAVKISLYKRKKQNESSSYGSLSSERLNAALTQLDQRLVWIPVVFVLVRCWGTVRWMIASTPPCYDINEECSIKEGRIWFHDSCYYAIYNVGLLYLQAIGDTGQGWANALLYVVFNATIARRLCPCLFYCWNRLRKKFERCQKKREYMRMRDEEQTKVAFFASSGATSIESNDTVKCPNQDTTVPPDRKSIHSVN